MANTIKVSIIVPLHVIVPRFFRDLEKFAQLNYANYEILVVSDRKVDINLPNTRLILTHKRKTGPAEKRDLAISKARGEICAFIDDDAYPDREWLKNAIVHFSHPKIAAVGGPGITPQEDGYWEKLTGLVYGSYFCGGAARYRFVPGEMQFIDDFPAYNLLVRKSVLKQIGGYGSYFYGGEDTFLCLKIVEHGYKILYDPSVVIFHHRRALFLPYLKQIGNIGMHRGYFAKRYPKTSLRPMYFLPSTLAIGFLAMLIAMLLGGVSVVLFLAAFAFFFTIAFLSIIIPAKSLSRALLASTGVLLTHIVYGLNFIRGLIAKKLYR